MILHKNKNTGSYHLSEETKRTRHVYDSIAEEYDKKWSNVPFMEERLNRFASYFKDHSIVLDAGCGTARDMKYLESKGVKSIGVDISEKMLKAARKNHPTALFVLMDLIHLAFKNGQFDGVWACASLIHLPKRAFEFAIGEFNRVLKSDAVIFISTKEGDTEKYSHDGRFTTYYGKNELTCILEKYGFEVFFYDFNQAYKSTFERQKLDTWINLWARKISTSQGT